MTDKLLPTAIGEVEGKGSCLLDPDNSCAETPMNEDVLKANWTV